MTGDAGLSLVGTTGATATRSRRESVLQLVRYSAVSGVSTTTSLVTLGVLVGLVGAPAMLANVVATGIGTVPSFELNRRWVWRANGRRRILTQVVPFCVLSFTGLVASTVAVGVTSAHTAGWGHWSHTVAVLAANVAAYGSLWIVQYLLLDRVLFRSRHRTPDDGADATVAELTAADATAADAMAADAMAAGCYSGTSHNAA